MRRGPRQGDRGWSRICERPDSGADQGPVLWTAEQREWERLGSALRPRRRLGREGPLPWIPIHGPERRKPRRCLERSVSSVRSPNRLAGTGAASAAGEERSARQIGEDPRSCRFPAKGTGWGREWGRSGDGVGTGSMSRIAPPPSFRAARECPPPRPRISSCLPRALKSRSPPRSIRSIAPSVSCITSVPPVCPAPPRRARQAMSEPLPDRRASAVTPVLLQPRARR